MEDIGGGASYAEGSFQSIVNVLTVRYTRIQYQALLLTRIQGYKDTISSLAFNSGSLRQRKGLSSVMKEKNLFVLY